MNPNTTRIDLPNPLVEKIRKKIEGTEFDTVSSYVVYVLRQVLSHMDEDNPKKTFSKEDEKKVKEKLKDLGYME